MIRRVGAVIAAVDGFTGERITDSGLLVQDGNGNVPVRKPDGYYVFWDDGKPELGVSIKSVWFESVTLIISVAELRKKKIPVFYVYLIPSGFYPFPADCCWQRGEAGAFHVVMAALKDTEKLFRIEDVTACGEQGSAVISVKNRYGLSLEDRLLYVCDGRGTGELCRAGEVNKGVTDRLCLTSPLKGSYEKETMKLRLVYRTRADYAGIFFVPGEFQLAEKEEESWDYVYAKERY